MPATLEEKIDPKSHEIHVGLDIPRATARQIHRWAREQSWPEGTQLEEPREYHVTLLYSTEGREHKDAWWIEHLERAEVRLKGLTAFPAQEKGYAYVLLLDAPEVAQKAQEMQEKAEAHGLPITQFDGGYKPHITVAYGPTNHLSGIKAPEFQFDIGPSSVSPTRPKNSSAPPKPPNYREGTEEKRCGTCKMFWQGNCWGYGNREVRGGAVCDSWSPEKKRSAYNPDEVQILDHLSLQNVSANLHYKFEEGGMDALEATEYAKRLLKLIGYPEDEITVQAALQAWQKMYPEDRLLEGGVTHPAEIQAPPTVPTESWPTRMANEPALTLYHGTSNRAWDLAQQQEGLHPWNPRDVANEIATHYGLDPEEFYNHPYFEFSRTTRLNDPNLYFTTDRRVAESYAKERSEQLTDALKTAHRMVHGDMYNQEFYPDEKSEFNHHKDRFIEGYFKNHALEPLVLRAQVPYSALGDQVTRMTNAGYAPEGNFTLPGPVPLEWLSTEEGSPEKFAATSRGLTYSFSRTAGETLPQERRRWETLGTLYPSQSIVTHQFPDNYTIQHHHTDTDVNRIGKFMQNCWQQGQHLDEARNNGYHYASLHDEHGMPRAAWYEYTNPWRNKQYVQTQIKQPLGMRNAELWQFPNSQYMPYLQEYADTKGYEFKEPRAPSAVNLDEVPGLNATIGPPRAAKTAGLPQYSEMVPTSAIKHLREYDRTPGGDPSIAADPEYWERLKNSVAQNGFTDPITLEYNPWTGKGYLGEGNHRLGIAEELGQDIPLMVYRTTKDDERMKPMHEPGTYQMQDEHGFSKFPQYAKPSLIGLPVTGPYVEPPRPEQSWGDQERALRDQQRPPQPPQPPQEEKPLIPSGDPVQDQIMKHLYGDDVFGKGSAVRYTGGDGQVFGVRPGDNRPLAGGGNRSAAFGREPRQSPSGGTHQTGQGQTSGAHSQSSLRTRSYGFDAPAGETSQFAREVLGPWESKGVVALHNEDPDKLHLHTVELPSDLRGQGYGHRFMNHVKAYSDAHGKPLVIDPVTNPQFFNQFDWLTPNQQQTRYEYSPEGSSTIPSEVNSPEDHWPDVGGADSPRDHGVQVSNEWVYTN